MRAVSMHASTRVLCACVWYARVLCACEPCACGRLTFVDELRVRVDDDNAQKNAGSARRYGYGEEMEEVTQKSTSGIYNFKFWGGSGF